MKTLWNEIYWHQKTHEVIRQYGRQQLKKEIAQIDEALFSKSSHLSFRQKISKIFSK